MPKLFFILLSLIIIGEIYALILLRLSLQNFRRHLRRILFISYIVLTLFLWGSVFLSRQTGWSNLPHTLRNIFAALAIGFFVAKILIATLMLVDDIRRFSVWLITKIRSPRKPLVPSPGSKIKRSVFIQRVALVLGGAVVGGFLYGITNRYNYQVRRTSINFKNLPGAFRGLKIVQISDIHAGSFDSREAVAKGVAKIMEEKPDIIFFTGDLVNNRAEEMRPYIDIFSRLKAPLGVYSTLGNHDYGDYVTWSSPAAKLSNLEELKSIHGQMGWKILVNEHVVVERGEEKIAIIGVENWGARANFAKYGDLNKAQAGLPQKNVPFKILLSHDPSHWDREVIRDYKDIDLTLSGHTHGMQFGIDIPGIKWSPVKYLYKNWAGLTQESNQYLYVNRGYGFLGYPGRLGILPEITVIELA